MRGSSPPDAAPEWVDRATGHSGGVFALWPLVDVDLDDTRLTVHVEIPGADPATDVVVEVDSGALVVRGWKRAPAASRPRVSERTFGRFYRSIPLPEGLDVDCASATSRDGVLTVEIPRAATSRGVDRRIEVTAG